MGIKLNKIKKNHFLKPTTKEVELQFQLKGILGDIEPKKYYAYYESVGWMVGKKKMYSWKAAIAGWILRMNEFSHKTKTNDKFSEQAIKARMERW